MSETITKSFKHSPEVRAYMTETQREYRAKKKEKVSPANRQATHTNPADSIEVECERCGYQWIPKVENPKECPKCQHVPGTQIRKKCRSLEKNQRLKICCPTCKYEWYPRNPHTQRCPVCSRLLTPHIFEKHVKIKIAKRDEIVFSKIIKLETYNKLAKFGCIHDNLDKVINKLVDKVYSEK